MKQPTINPPERPAPGRSDESSRLLMGWVAEPGIYLLDPDGRVVGWGAAAERLLGYRAADILGEPFARLFPPEAVARGEPERELEEAAGRGLSCAERWHVRRDGTRFRGGVVTTALRDEHGSLRGYSRVTCPGPEWGEGEEAPPEEEAREHARLLDLAHVLIRDLDDRIIFWNQGAEQMYGWTRAEALGQTSHALLRTRFPQPLEEIRAELYRRDCWEGELVHTRKDGSAVVVASHWALYRDARGNPRAVLEVNNDVTRLKEAEEALREADRRKDDFLAILGHELRNSLAPLRNGLQVLRLRGQDRREAVSWAQDMMGRQLHHLVRLVDDLLDVSRIGRGKIQLHKGPVDLAEVVAQAVETSRPLIDAHRHELKVCLPPGPLPLEADRNRLAQVLANLLNNAAKYTEEGGRIWLAAERDGGDVVLRVKDTGIGIAAEALPHLFDLFVQGEDARHRSEGGLGIGLTLARLLVEMHGGSMQAWSPGPGKGSEFVVRLPAGPEIRPAAAGADPEKAGRAASARRVLVVEDNADSAESLAVLLRLTGHEVRTAADGEAALEAVSTFRPEVVLLDIGLPGMSGYEVACRLRKQPGLEGVLLVAVSGYGQEEVLRRSQEAGFQAHLVKPVDFDAVQALLAPGGPPAGAGTGG